MKEILLIYVKAICRADCKAIGVKVKQKFTDPSVIDQSEGVLRKVILVNLFFFPKLGKVCYDLLSP